MGENDNLFGEHLWYDNDKPNPWSHYVWKLSSQGEFQKIIPDASGVLESYSFVRDHFGRMYWADRSSGCQKISRKNINNSTTTLGEACMNNIRFMKSTREGIIYLSTSRI